MVLVGALTTACSVQSGFEDSALEVEPRLYLYTLTGNTAMQSVQGGIVVDNPSMEVSTFGLDERSSALGILVGVGDGFAGGEFLFERVEMTTTKTGTLTQDWN